MTFLPSSYQSRIFDWVETGTGDAIVGAVAGSGKCLGKGTPVLTYSGDVVAVEDVVEGDLLMGPDSRPRRVLSTCTGHSQLYRITPTKGHSWVCNDVHVLTLAGTNRFKGQIIDIPLDQYLWRCREQKSFKDQWKVFRTGVEFSSNSLSIDPYFIGLWIGDGTTNAVQFTTPDKEIIEYLCAFALTYGAEATVVDEDNRGLKRVYLRVGERGKTKPGSHVLRQELLSRFRNADGEKFIPHEYLVASRKDRLELLAGLLDTDGYYGTGVYEFSSKFKRVADQVCFLCRSLGFAAYPSCKAVQLDSMPEPRDYWRVSISGDLSCIPCKVPHKQAGPRQQIKNPLVTGFTVTPERFGEYYGFTLDGDGRFLLGDFTVTHNSTTLEQICQRLPHDERRGTLVIAYNKHIADAMKARPGLRGVSVSTIHALGMRALRRFYNPSCGYDWVDADKYRKLVRYYWSVNLNASRETENEVLCRDVTRFCLVTLADPTDTDSLLAMCDRYGVDVPPASEEIVFRAAATVLQWGREGLPTPDSHGLTYKPSERISYEDMIYLPNVVDECRVETYRFVLCDECQDLSAAQLGIAMAARAEGGRCLFVGDRNQAIYAFSGADAESFDNIKARLGAAELPLSVCYRCPVAVVERARELQPGIECAPGAPLGVAQDVSESSAIQMIRPGDMVLCRVNAPLIGIAFGLIRRGIGATILGRDIAVGLTRTLDTIARMRLPREGREGVPQNVTLFGAGEDDFSFAAFHRFAEAYRDAQVAALSRRKDSDAAILALNDRVDCLCELYAWCTTTRGSKSVGDLRAEITSLFENKSALVTLSSIHKAKGGEAKRVFLFKPHLLPHPMARTDAARVQEDNLKYVAITRAMEELYFARDYAGEAAASSKSMQAVISFAQEDRPLGETGDDDE